MNRSVYILVITLLMFSFSISQAQSKKFGLGVIFGEPTGLSAKLWVSNTNALDFGLGWSVEGYRFNGFDEEYNRVTRTHFHIDYLWHSFYAVSPNGQFPLYYGIGGRINSGPEYTGTFALRGVFGIEWLPHKTPLDVFAEIVPTLGLISTTGLGIEGAFGIRVFF